MKVRQQSEQQGQPGYPTQHSGLTVHMQEYSSDVCQGWSWMKHERSKLVLNLQNSLLHLIFLKFWTYMLALPDPSGQPISNQMIPGGGNAQPMAPRHPGAPNGMCESSSLVKFQARLYESLLLHPDSSCSSQTPTGQHRLRRLCPVTAEGCRKQTDVPTRRHPTRTLVNALTSTHRFSLTRGGTALLSAFQRQ